MTVPISVGIWDNDESPSDDVDISVLVSSFFNREFNCSDFRGVNPTQSRLNSNRI